MKDRKGERVKVSMKCASVFSCFYPIQGLKDERKSYKLQTFIFAFALQRVHFRVIHRIRVQEH